MSNDLLDFTGKTVLIIGGSSGIGNGTAQAFRARGADVYVWGTRASVADYADTEGSDLEGLTYHSVDVAKPDQIDAAGPDLDTLDVLIQCQGAVVYGGGEFEREGWNDVINVNLNSLMDIARKYHDALAAAKGAMIIVSSTAAYHATMGNPAYGASKSGAVSLARTLGVAWARDGIRVNGIAPGYVRTKMTEITFGNEKRAEQAVRAIPLRRTGEPSELANAALFLASPMASYIVGQTIPVDGGLSLS